LTVGLRTIEARKAAQELAARRSGAAVECTFRRFEQLAFLGTIVGWSTIADTFEAAWPSVEEHNAVSLR
jgi:hypothetical protein